MDPSTSYRSVLKCPINRKLFSVTTLDIEQEVPVRQNESGNSADGLHWIRN